MTAVFRLFERVPETIEVPPELVGKRVMVIVRLLDSNKSWSTLLTENGVKPEDADKWQPVEPDLAVNETD